MAFSQTPVPQGDVYGEWDAAGSPYMVYGNISIPGDSTLVIDPGVTVEFQGYFSLIVTGKLLAIGEPGDSIRFTVADTTGLFANPQQDVGGWHRIVFNDTYAGDTSIIQYCILEYSKACSTENMGGALYINMFSDLIIKDNLFRKNVAYDGGAIYLTNDATPVIMDNVIEHNYAIHNGGGINCYCYNYGPELKGNVICYNFAGYYGGGIWQDTYGMGIINNEIFGNEALNSGGGIYYNAESYVVGNVIHDNTAGNYGGGIGTYGMPGKANTGKTGTDERYPQGVLCNNLIYNNNAFNGGGIGMDGMYMYSSWCNNTIVYNTAQYGGGVNSSGDPISFVNTIFWGNLATVSDSQYYGAYNFDHCLVEGGATGAIDINPLFTDTANNDYTLQRFSPCTEAGTPDTSGFNIPEYDLWGNPRIMNTNIDIGAYENPEPIACGTINDTAVWDADTVFVTCDVTVAYNALLTIMPGTVVEFQGYYQIYVDGGTITAIGTPEDSIVFTINDTTGFYSTYDQGGWNGLYIWFPAKEKPARDYYMGEFAYCRMEFAKGTEPDYGSGGLFRCEYAPVRVENCYIHDNVSNDNDGGAFNLHLSDAEIINCKIVNNRANQSGGAIYSYESECNCIGNLFVNNTTQDTTDENYGGGVIWTDGYMPVNLINNTMYDNYSGGCGGAVYSYSIQGGLYSTNNIIRGNSAYREGQQVFMMGSMGVGFYNCNIEGGIDSTCVFQLMPYTGDDIDNIDADPVFEDISSGLYNIRPNSPCRNAGTPDTTDLYLPEFDMDGNLRVMQDTVDIGAYESPGCLLEIEVTGTNPACYGYEDGSAVVVVIGGVEPFTYQWDDPGSSTDSVATELLANIWYRVTVTDSESCVATDSIILSQSTEILLNIIAADASCGNSNGFATVYATGGVLPYTYLWSTGDITNYTDTLDAGMHSLLVEDSEGCFKHEYFMINNENAPVVTVDSVIDVSCFNEDDGAVYISVTSGSPPYQYLWSNGDTIQDIQNLYPGPYEVNVLDTAGCLITENVFVDQPEKLSVEVFINDAVCDSTAGSAWVEVAGGTQPYYYQWSSGGTDYLEEGLTAGVYMVVVTDANGCIAEMDENIIINDIGGPVVTVDSIIPASCGYLGSIYLSVTEGYPPYESYLWSTGDTLEDLTDVSPDVYDFIVTDSLGCIGTYSGELPFLLPAEQPICVVTVDSASSTNLVVWEKVQETGVSHYNIYRETSIPDYFQLVDTVPFDSLSVYVDPVASPFVRSWRYAISSVDSCGNESPLSGIHKTIHLTMNIGYLGNSINLIWDNYEGFNYNTFYVNRYTAGVGWETLDSLPKTLHSYTDGDVSAGTLTYAVTVKKPGDPCWGNKVESGPYSQSLSNLEDNSTVIISDVIPDGDILIFPNPNEGIFTIQRTSENSDPVNISIVNITGQLIYTKDSRDLTEYIDISGNAAGMYFVRITGKEQSKVVRIIKY